MDLAHRLLTDVDLGQLPQLARHLLNDPATRGTLLYNPSLPSDAISHLLQTASTGARKLSADELGRLAKLDLDTAAVDTFIAKVRAVGPLTTLMRWQDLSEVQLAALATAGKHVKGKLVEELLHDGVDPALLVDPVRRTGGRTLLAFLSEDADGLIPDDDVVELIGTVDEWLPPTRGMGAMLRPVLERGPAILQAALQAPNPAVRAVAAGHRNLTTEQAWQLARFVRADDGRWAIDPTVSVTAQEFVWQGLLNSPVCPQEVLDAATEAFANHAETTTAANDGLFETRDRLRQRLRYKPAPVTVPFHQVDDPDQLAWIVRRTCDPKRKVDLPEVLANPHLDHTQITDLLRLDTGLPAITARQIVEPLAVQLDRHGLEHERWWDQSHGQPDVPAVDATEETFEQRQRRNDREHELERWQREQVVLDDDELAGLPLSALSWTPGAAGTAAARLGDDVAAWTTLLDLADGWEGTYGELLDTAPLLAAA